MPVIHATSKYVFRVENEELRREGAMLLPSCLEEEYLYQPRRFSSMMVAFFESVLPPSPNDIQFRGDPQRHAYPRVWLQTDDAGRAMVCTAFLWHMHCLATMLWHDEERREEHVPKKCLDCCIAGERPTCGCGWSEAYVRGCRHLEEHYHPDELVVLVREAALSAGRSLGLNCSLGIELNAADWPDLEWPFAGGAGVEYDIIGGDVMRRPTQMHLILGTIFLALIVSLSGLAIFAHPVA